MDKDAMNIKVRELEEKIISMNNCDACTKVRELVDALDKSTEVITDLISGTDEPTMIAEDRRIKNTILVKRLRSDTK